jgi:hypothetical protein
MSYDFGIWKRSASTKTAMLADAYMAISEGDAHPAIAPFDLTLLEQAFEIAFGAYKNDPEAIICCDARSSEAGSWMIVQCSFLTPRQSKRNSFPSRWNLACSYMIHNVK